MRFDGKVAIVTGAARGIGEAYALALASEGAAVVVADLDREGGERVVGEIEAAGGRALFTHTDVSSEESTRAMAEAAREAFGGVDCLVNNAAIYAGMRMDRLVDVDWDYYDRFMSVNMNGALLATRAVRRMMTERGGGSILNQSSVAAYMGMGPYGIAKLALHGITHTLARELGHRNIRVNAIAAGPIDTEATRRMVSEHHLKAMLASMPLARLGTVDDLIGACLFLLSDASSWITGQILGIDGGQVVRP